MSMSANDPTNSGVNFTNVLQAAFALVDPKSAKKLLNLTVFFALLGFERVKAARRTLVKLNPDPVACHNIQAFLTFFDIFCRYGLFTFHGKPNQDGLETIL